MFGNCDKMVIPPTTNQLPQTHHIDSDDDKASMVRVMEKAGEQQQQEALKCPRCDSSNTKFCYYNNYSLSQPRHFCKACKRYWTRGGTLRNVPVGGGCRKNKRVKRPTTSSLPIDTAPAPTATTSNPSSQPHIDIASTSNNINPLFYGLPCDVNLPFPRLNSRIPSSGYDHQLNALGLDFSSGIVMSTEAGGNGYTNGFASNNTFLSNYSSIFSSTSTSTTSITPVMLSSTLLQHKFISDGGVKDVPGSNTTFEGLAPLEQQQMANNCSEAGMVALKDVKVEGGQNQMHMEHVALSDPTLYWNTATPMAAWNDQPNNIGPSLASLI